MNKENELKDVVKEKYSEIVSESSGCGCGSGCCGTQLLDINMIGDSYEDIDGHVKEADLGLGCGVPTEYADIKKGDIVLDLGSGAGNDVFIARAITGDAGRVIGVDFTEKMIEKAVSNNKKLGYQNIEFRLGDIEALPIEDNSIDVVLSNCVLNLVPDKMKAFSEIFRVLKTEGHFCISDVVIRGEMPAGLQRSAEMYAGCVAGAMKQEEYLEVIKTTGFEDVIIEKSKQIEIPEETIKNYLTEEEINKNKNNDFGIFSITVKGYKNNNIIK